ncbi:maleylpyruvate isomerase family mycothiol-dependent enzyme [Mycobacterium talmoniae]|uniref:maleylpyruvate isomerase family mycothiol-dependent enzyme n=1 Tax=Mycobacterium talmoniae TaxID=1858794 RepID=UPI0009F26B96|nr:MULTISPECIES: maleylpyruvate isomerase family mycothiol-dependent enzyme [Mycobacterium]
MDRDVIFAAVADERRQIADLLDTLDDAQLATPSLCAGWDIKTVAAHLVSVFADSFWVFMGTALRRASMARAVDGLARCRARLPADEIVTSLRQNADHHLSPPLFGPLDPLADVLVHRGDITIPLDLPFEPDPARASLALDFLTGPWPFGFVPLGLLRGISLHATDVDRTWRTGVEVRGSTAALMMTIAGRAVLVDELEGPGLPLLRHRLGAD